MVRGAFFLLPPPPSRCQECARDHLPEDPHDRESWYYSIRFQQLHGRWPSWADAMAHCDPGTREAWREGLQAIGIDPDVPGPQRPRVPSKPCDG